jgi:SAM-dependent methyltransferase
MVKRIKKFLGNRIINRYQIFYFISKIIRKTFTTQNKFKTVLFLFFNIIVEILFSLITLLKFSTYVRKDDDLTKNYNAPFNSMVIQLIGMIYFIYYNRDQSLFHKNSSFMDIGCGNGKVLFFSNIIFNKSYGIEVNSYHAKLAKKNLQNSNVEILNEDFLSPDFIIPKDVNFFFFFSPFNKEEHLKVFVQKLTNHGKVNKKNNLNSL